MHIKHRSESGIGLYREYAIAIENEGDDSIWGNVYYVTMQITLPIPEFTRNERNFHCDVLHITPDLLKLYSWITAVFSPGSPEHAHNYILKDLMRPLN